QALTRAIETFLATEPTILETLTLMSEKG
ncbi:MAG: hypothetical protein H6R26_2549, partial [Proteobacteria bacterium]|nr:hypothetical protein [Pseudomonadota bacterium]